MIKKCLKMFAAGIVAVIVGVSGIVVLAGIGVISDDDLDDLNIDIDQRTPEYAYTETTYTDYPQNLLVNLLAEEAAAVESIDVTMNFGTFYISPGNELALYCEGDEADITHSIRDGVLTVNCGGGVHLLDFDGPVVTLCLPDKLYDSIEVKVSAGEMNMDNISTNRLTFTCSAGQSYLYNITAKESANISMTAGNCVLGECTLRNAFLKMSAGDMSIDGARLTGENTVKLSAGTLYMSIMGNSGDYSIGVKKSAGDVYVDGYNLEDGQTYGANNGTDASGTLNIELTAGECNINFNGNEYEEGTE